MDKSAEFKILFLTLLTTFLLGVTTSPSLADEPKKGVLTLVAENDVLRGTDQHFTHGSRISYYSGIIREDWLSRIAELMPYFHSQGDGVYWRTNLALGQNIYSPEDITIKKLITDERPYAGYLYLGLGLVRAQQGGEQQSPRVDSFELQLGVVGPLAQGEEVQSWWHANISDSPQPMGWEHQLKNEPILNLYWDRQWRKDLTKTEGMGADVIPHVGIALGNADTHVNSGLTLRLGSGLANDNGPPRIRPSLPGAGVFRKGEKISAYLFAGGEFRLVGRNIFLDGNSFSHSHKVSKKSVVADAQYGLVVAWGKIKLSLTNIIRSREFSGQENPDRFTAFSVSWLL